MMGTKQGGAPSLMVVNQNVPSMMKVPYDGSYRVAACCCSLSPAVCRPAQPASPPGERRAILQLYDAARYQTHEHPRDDNDEVREPPISDIPTRGPIDSHVAPTTSGPTSEAPTASYGRGRRFSRPVLTASIAALIAVCAGLIGGFVGVRMAGAGASSATTAASAHGVQQKVVSLVSAAQKSVVEVTSVKPGEEALGSGEILTTSGYIVTNEHVVAGFCSHQATLSGGRTVQAQLVGQAPQNDLAVLKITPTGNLQPITVGTSSALQVGDLVVAIGNPLGLRQSATLGIVSALNRTATEAPSGPAGTFTGLIQTSAPINPGNSGGALINLQGHLHLQRGGSGNEYAGREHRLCHPRRAGYHGRKPLDPRRRVSDLPILRPT
jgi:Trypsin-like peptidase domain